MSAAALLRCSVVHALPGDEVVFELALPPGATVESALTQARRRSDELPAERAALIDWAGPVGVFGEACSRDRVLAAGDRIELYRPLRNDPKESRRRRARLAHPAARR